MKTENWGIMQLVITFDQSHFVNYMTRWLATRPGALVG